MAVSDVQFETFLYLVICLKHTPAVIEVLNLSKRGDKLCVCPYYSGHCPASETGLAPLSVEYDSKTGVNLHIRLNLPLLTYVHDRK